MGKYIIAGGSGFIGKHLSALLLGEGHEVVILTTQKNRVNTSDNKRRFVYWNPKETYIDEAFSMSECKLINLSGAGVAEKRWTPARKREIVESRTDSLNTLYQAARKKQIQPVHLVSSSAIGFYGEGLARFSEEDHGDESFLSSTCRKWEDAARQFAALEIPVAVIRTGIVLGKEGGALKEFLKPLRFGIAGIPSDGNQLYSWIHVDDISRLYLYLSTHHKEGVFNGVAPHPVSVNTIFTSLIRHTHPFFFNVHAPDFFLKLLLGEMAVEVLKSTNVSSQKIQDDGFLFLYDNIDPCIDALMG